MTQASSLAIQHYLIQPIDKIFVKDCEFLPFARNMSKNVGKNVGKNLSSKYSQKIFDYAKHYATAALKAAFKNKIADKITRLSKTSPNINLETNEEEEILRERFIPSKQDKTVLTI